MWEFPVFGREKRLLSGGFAGISAARRRPELPEPPVPRREKCVPGKETPLPCARCGAAHRPFAFFTIWSKTHVSNTSYRAAYWYPKALSVGIVDLRI